MTSMDTDDVVEAAPKLGNIDQIIMHPLVLLSAADHYHRVARGTRKRVVGVLLGMVSKGVVDCTNSFAVPFEEDSRNPVSPRITVVHVMRYWWWSLLTWTIDGGCYSNLFSSQCHCPICPILIFVTLSNC